MISGTSHGICLLCFFDSNKLGKLLAQCLSCNFMWMYVKDVGAKPHRSLSVPQSSRWYRSGYMYTYSVVYCCGPCRSLVTTSWWQPLSIALFNGWNLANVQRRIPRRKAVWPSWPLRPCTHCDSVAPKPLRVQLDTYHYHPSHFC